MGEANERIIQFMEMLQSLYFEKRDLNAVYQLLDPDITWIGTGKWEICPSLKDARKMLLNDKMEHDEGFSILYSHYQILHRTNDTCAVLGQIGIRETGSVVNVLDQDLRLTAILSISEYKIRLRHIHLSVPDPIQEQGEFFPKKYKVLETQSLKKLVNQQSIKLKKQSRDWSALIANIPGGIRCCENDDCFTLKSYSERFLDMLGYTKEDISQLFQNSFLQMIVPEDRKRVKESIRVQLSAGNAMTCEYRVIHHDGNILWLFDKGQLVTEEDGTKIIYGVLEDITSMREAQNQLKVTLERYQIIFDQTTDIVFEWDANRDALILSSNWRKKFGYDLESNHVSRQNFESNIHPDDLEIFHRQQTELKNRAPYTESEIRIIKSDKNYIWCRIRTTVQRNSEGKILRFIGLITDIDDEKKHSQNLLDRAERDALTGVYNRGAVEKQINDYLNSAGYTSNHILMIIDVDDFKRINDSRGHLYGDAVLNETAQSLQSLFPNGIAGRIGGDEFIVLVKNVIDTKQAVKEAEKINFNLSKAELSSNGLTVSTSIGISYYPSDGKNFTELYKKADIALYQAKKLGKGQFFRYSSKITEAYLTDEIEARKSSVNESIDSNTFRQGLNNQLVEYIFQMLYKSIEVETAINLILSIVGRYYNVSRAYIFENTADGKHCSNTFEWCAPTIEPQIDQLQNICYDNLADYSSNFDKNGVFYCNDVSKLHPDVQSILEPQGIKSMLQCAIYDNGKFWGYVGFDDCNKNRFWVQEQVNTLSFIAEIISIFLLKDRVKNKLAKTIDMMQTILDHQGLMTYVIDKNYRLVYMNSQTQTAVPEAQIGNYCYKDFFDNSQICDFCPINQKNPKNVTIEIYNPKLKLWVQVEYFPIHWIDSGDGWVISCHDISKFKN